MPLGWIDLEYMPAWKAASLFALLAAPIVLLGLRSLAGLGPVRRWVAVGARLLVLLVLVLIVGGARWQRTQRSVQVWAIRDISRSTQLTTGYTGKNVQDAVEQYLRQISSKEHKHDADDKIGVISFADSPLIDSLPSPELVLDARALREPGDQTNIAEAIQHALATFSSDAMKRILLITDGNQNAGDLETALAAAIAQRVPIDVMPLHYAVTNEIIVEKVSAPSFKRENDAFDIFVSMISTNRESVGGTLEVLQEGTPLAKKRVTIEGAEVLADGRIEPRKHVERVRVPALRQRGVLRFKAIFTPDVLNDREAVAAGKSVAGDTLTSNNSAGAFTFIQGKGRVLYVDNSRDGSGKTLGDALALEGINVQRVGIDQVPDDPVAMQDFDSIILNNVPRGRTPLGSDGLSDRQDKMLAAYVHDFGGGLVMIGGDSSLGAGGWQGSRLEEVMPVSFDIPAQRQMPKGALVVVIHSCEMPDGNYWGEQCAIKATETLSSQDDIGIISFHWKGGGNMNANWDYVLAPKGDGITVVNAIKHMQPGDMPSFDETVKLAIDGTGPTAPCLKNNNAAVKHMIVVSDGDPQPPAAGLIADCKKLKITISTVSVFPHGGFVSGTMQQMAKDTGGRYYGPIESNPSQLPQIFIKEATVVRRTLIQESLPPDPPFAVAVRDTGSDIMAGIRDVPPITGLVLSQRKNDPSVKMPMVILNGGKTDPLFAHWQAGLGKAAIFASDASARWQPAWLTPQQMGQYAKFWAQVVRGVSRPPMSTDFAVTTERNGDKAKVTVEVTNKDAGYTNFVNFDGAVIDADGQTQNVRFVQTGPGTYTGEFPSNKPGNYVVALHYAASEKQQGWLVSGLSVNESVETRDLKSNDGLLEDIARRTGGRVFPAWDPSGVDLYSRDHLVVGASPMPVWDILIPFLLALIIIDVAIRRIAWDWNATKKAAAATAGFVRSFTLTREVESKQTLDALRKVREEVAEAKSKQPEPGTPPRLRPDPRAKFDGGKAVEGDITQIVGGATAKAVPPPPKDPKPKGGPGAGGHTGSLLEAKRRAQEQIRRKGKGESDK
ncbi:MAG: VWA domain-containing protein [Tepidisphaeraceae bacterium]|jgi:uncharacterized membrane protein